MKREDRSDLRGDVLEGLEEAKALRQNIVRQHVAQTQLLLRRRVDERRRRSSSPTIASETKNSRGVVLFGERDAALEPPLHRAFGAAGHHLQAQQCRGGRIRHRHRPHGRNNNHFTSRPTKIDHRENSRKFGTPETLCASETSDGENVAMTLARWRARTTPRHDQFPAPATSHLAKSPKIAETNTPVKRFRRFAFKEPHQNQKNPKENNEESRENP